MKNNFKEQIKDPRWQKRRLEIMQRDDFACQMCGDKESTLNVHHIRYVKGRKYWEYDDWELVTLCEDCHDFEHMAKNEALNDEIKELNSIGLTYIEICSMLYKIHNLLIEDSNTLKRSLSELLGDGLCFNVKGDVVNIEKWRRKL